ncbi:hypothetical protein GSI_07273 [Ganoderma sinense ZZ0214-1]|uniref:Uncharacterized protein n=1 Tax=Ganoderma sinense ZZ0214-1 TaxID=1077348 RepID=A0A2G8S9X8_9APHY|nr:hypothetical protein GSI_07273 [Ganoderma sinense ZZ0214-1]
MTSTGGHGGSHESGCMRAIRTWTQRALPGRRNRTSIKGEREAGNRQAPPSGTTPTTVATTTTTQSKAISAPFNVTMTIPQNQKETETRAVTVFCASSKGTDIAFVNAAKSLGKALADAGRPLVYGGGSHGLMGTVSGAALAAGGDVTGVVPYAMVVAGGERGQVGGANANANASADRATYVALEEQGREKVVVNSMHERKAEMAKRSCAFIGLPGGYGTFEEVLEVVCWSQIGIHRKPVLVLNVHGYWNPLRELVRNGIKSGFILEKNEQLLRFVEGPKDHAEHENFDWGKAAVEALDTWENIASSHFYNWHLRKDGKAEEDTLGAT